MRILSKAERKRRRNIKNAMKDQDVYLIDGDGVRHDAGKAPGLRYFEDLIDRYVKK